jgi:hypothetical protein
MPTSAIASVVKMMQSLPDATQNKVVEHLRENGSCQFRSAVADSSWSKR